MPNRIYLILVSFFVAVTVQAASLDYILFDGTDNHSKSLTLSNGLLSCGTDGTLSMLPKNLSLFNNDAGFFTSANTSVGHLTLANISGVMTLAGWLTPSDVGADASGAAATVQAYAIQRTNHTGTQAPSTISSGTFGGGINLPYSQLLSAPTIPSNTNQLMNGNGFITATGTAALITGTISNAQVSGLGTAATQASNAFDASGAAATSQAYAIQRANHTGTQSPITISSGTFGSGVNLPYSQLLSAPTIPSNTNQLTNGNGFITTTGTAAAITGTIPNTQVSGLGTASTQASSAFDASGAAATAQAYAIQRTNHTGTQSPSTISSGTFGIGVNLPYSQLLSAPTIPSNTNQLTNGNGFITATGTAAAITGTIPNTQVSGLGTASTQASSAFDANGAAAMAQAYAIQRTNHTGTQTPSTISSGTFGGGVNLPYSQLLSAPTIPSNTNQLTNGNGFITATGTASTITGTIPNTQVSGLGTASIQASSAFDANGAAATAQAYAIQRTNHTGSQDPSTISSGTFSSGVVALDLGITTTGTSISYYDKSHVLQTFVGGGGGLVSATSTSAGLAATLGAGAFTLSGIPSYSVTSGTAVYANNAFYSSGAGTAMAYWTAGTNGFNNFFAANMSFGILIGSTTQRVGLVAATAFNGDGTALTGTTGLLTPWSQILFPPSFVSSTNGTSVGETLTNGTGSFNALSQNGQSISMAYNSGGITLGQYAGITLGNNGYITTAVNGGISTGVSGNIQTGAYSSITNNSGQTAVLMGGTEAVTTGSYVGMFAGTSGTAATISGTILNTQVSGLGTASTQASGAFDASGAATTAQGNSLQKTSNLGDLGSPSVARSNLSLNNLSNTSSAGAFTVGNGSVTYASAGQISSVSNPTNLFFTTSNLPNAQVTGLGTAATTAASAYATSAQGTLAASALQPSGNGSSLTGITSGQISGLGTAATTAASAYATAAQGTLAASALQPTGNGSSLTGITPSQIGAASSAQGTLAGTALQPAGNGSSLTGITSGQISGLGSAATTAASAYATSAQGTLATSALQPSGNGSLLTGITSGQISGLGTAATTAASAYATAAQGAIAASALQPTGNGSSLTGITASQVGAATSAQGTLAGTALQPAGSGASLTGITPAQIGAATSAQGTLAGTGLQPAGNGSSLTGITSGQISGLGTAATTAASAYATSAQGALAASALQPAGNGSSLTGITSSQVTNSAAGGASSFAAGSGTTTAAYSAAIGNGGLAVKIAQLVQGFNPGFMQITTTGLFLNTTNATQTELTLNGAATSGTANPTSNRFLVDNNKTYDCSIVITARTSAGVSNHFARQCLIHNNSGTAAIEGSIQVIGTDYNPSSLGLTIQADSTNKSLQLLVTGVASTNINWLATVTANEITY